MVQADSRQPEAPTQPGSKSSSKTPSRSTSSVTKSLSRQSSSVGSLCADLPSFVTAPPIEAVVFGWGVAEDGQLGLDTDANVLSPKVVEALLGTRFRGRQFGRGPLIAGSRLTLAIDGEGKVLSWGWNARSSLGHGHRGNEKKPRRIAALKGVNIVQAACGGWHCLAVSNTGQAYAWGGNEYGQCGVAQGKRDVPEPTPCLPDQKVVQVAAGGMHTCALTESGQVWTWGEPWGEFSMQLDRSPRAVPDATDVAKIACGAFHNLALTRSGHVVAWGINDFGQLGNGSTVYATSPGQVVGLEDIAVSDIAAAGWHSLAITTSGEVYVWGRGEYGRLGLGDKGGSSRLRPCKVKAIEDHRVVQASCGGTHTMVLTAEGRIFGWGRGSFGRLGTGFEKDCHSPVEVFLPGGPERWRVISVACGGRHTMALALPDNGEVNNREVVKRRLTSDSGGVRNFEEEEEDEYEHHGELQDGEYDEEDTEPGVGSTLAGDAVIELIETGSLTAAVDQAMVFEPPDQELTGSPRDMDYDVGQQDPSGGSPVSDENNTDFAAVHSVLSAIDAHEPTSD